MNLRKIFEQFDRDEIRFKLEQLLKKDADTEKEMKRLTMENERYKKEIQRMQSQRPINTTINLRNRGRFAQRNNTVGKNLPPKKTN